MSASLSFLTIAAISHPRHNISDYSGQCSTSVVQNRKWTTPRTQPTAQSSIDGTRCSVAFFLSDDQSIPLLSSPIRLVDQKTGFKIQEIIDEYQVAELSKNYLQMRRRPEAQSQRKQKSDGRKQDLYRPQSHPFICSVGYLTYPPLTP
jgi:hypothetical protein